MSYFQPLSLQSCTVKQPVCQFSLLPFFFPFDDLFSEAGPLQHFLQSSLLLLIIMTFNERASSIDMASIELRTSPAPSYMSSFKNQQYLHTDSTSNNPYFQSATITGILAEKDAPTKADHDDPNHPHYIEPASKFYDHLPRRSYGRRQWPKKRILIPWLLALVFFLTTLWFTSILLGARFLSIMHPTASTQPAQEIKVYINGDVLRGVTETAAVIPTPAPRTRTVGVTATSDSTVTVAPTASSTYTGRMHLAQTGFPDVDVGAKGVKRGFVTVFRD
ncbi:hypothetical protein HBH75_069490 [Parastagonospora nodorum]|nr:hypothetical protein HBH75_069490 [Parastagonospora nodorum]